MNPDPYTPMAPTAPFDYTMRTTAVMEHSRGIAWTADLLRNGATVGTIEQHGDGGPDRVYADRGLARADWNAAVTAAFAGDEEDHSALENGEMENGKMGRRVVCGQ